VSRLSSPRKGSVQTFDTIQIRFCSGYLGITSSHGGPVIASSIRASRHPWYNSPVIPLQGHGRSPSIAPRSSPSSDRLCGAVATPTPVQFNRIQFRRTDPPGLPPRRSPAVLRRNDSPLPAGICPNQFLSKFRYPSAAAVHQQRLCTVR